MFDAELCNDCVNRADLHAVAFACVAEHCSLDMCVTAWVQEGEHLQAFNEACLIFGTIEALQKFLNHNASCDDSVAVQKRPAQDGNGCMHRLRVTAKGERPSTGVNKQAHLRLRSAL